MKTQTVDLVFNQSDVTVYFKGDLEKAYFFNEHPQFEQNLLNHLKIEKVIFNEDDKILSYINNKNKRDLIDVILKDYENQHENDEIFYENWRY